MIAMRTILISCIFMLVSLGVLQAQELEHFTVKKYIDTYQFHPKFKKEVNANYGFWQFSSEYYKYFKKELRDSIAQLSEDAVKHFTETRLCTHLSFDKNGNIFRISFSTRSTNYGIITDRELLLLYQIIQKMKIDMEQVKVAEDFEAGYISFSLSNLLKE